MSDIANLEQEVRRLINKPRKHSVVFKNQAHFNKLCSSMDTVGDTEIAITQYLEKIDKSATTGELYILLYGILLVLFVQQDAVRHLSESLKLGYEDHPALKKIRDIINNSVGHPTQRSHGSDDTSFNFIARVSMSRSGYRLMKTYENKSPSFNNVNIIELIDDQRNVLKDVLRDIVDKLKKEEMDHRKKYKDDKLLDVFPDTLSYLFEKITEGIYREDQYRELGFGVLEIIEKIQEELKQKLISRKIFDAYDVKEEFEWVEYSIHKLQIFFGDPIDASVNKKDAYIYLSFLRKRFTQLKEIAAEIDKDYESEDE